MDVINPSHLWKIQRFTAVVALILNLIAILTNFMSTAQILQKVVNIGAMFLITLLLVPSLFVNHKVMRFIQILIFLLVGASTILLGAGSRFVGDILFITGVLLAYTYQIISTYSFKTIAAIILSMLILRVVSGFLIHPGDILEEIIISCVSITLILFLVTLLKNELIWYLEESQKNEIYIRAGMNITGFAHGLDMGTALNIVRALKLKMSEGDPNRAGALADSLEKMLLQKNRIKEQLLYAVGQNNLRSNRSIDLHRNLLAIKEIMQLNREVLKRIRVELDFYPGRLQVTASPFEIYFILHNIITNAVEAMLAERQQHTLQLKTRRHKNRGILIITDTGPGFPFTSLRQIPSTKEQGGGFGLLYTLSMLRHNNIRADFQNREEGGARVTLSFKLKGDEHV